MKSAKYCRVVFLVGIPKASISTNTLNTKGIFQMQSFNKATPAVIKIFLVTESF